MLNAMSIADVLEAAPSPKQLAGAMLQQFSDESRRKPFSQNVFHNPKIDSYDCYGYLCYLIGLEVESFESPDGGIVNSGYCVAPDGSRELITRVGDSALGYSPTASTTAGEQILPEDQVLIWSPMNQNLNSAGESMSENKVDPSLESQISRRVIPLDIARQLKLIYDQDLPRIAYVPFVPKER